MSEHTAYQERAIESRRTSLNGVAASRSTKAFDRRAWRGLGVGVCALCLLLLIPAARATGQSVRLDEVELAFLHAQAQSAFAGMQALIVAQSGLPIDIGEIVEGGVIPYDFKTSPTNIGLWIASAIAARDRGYLTEEEAAGAVRVGISSLERMEVYEGFYYNWYDLSEQTQSSIPPVGAQTIGPGAQRFVSSVDNGNLTAALMLAVSAFAGTPIEQTASEILTRQDYALFYQEDWLGRPRINHGYNTDTGEFSPYHYGTLMTEARLMVLIAILRGDVPEGGLAEYMDASTTTCFLPAGEEVTSVASWGGSLFEELFPDLFLDEKTNAPWSLGENHRKAVQVHAASQDRASGLWGWAPCEDVDGRYDAFGVACLGAGGDYPLGPVSPYSVAMAARYAPEKALLVLRAIAGLEAVRQTLHVGFPDAVSADGQAAGPNILTLDKGIEFIALHNLIEESQGRSGLSKYFWDYLDRIGKWALGKRLLSELALEPAFSTP